MISHINKTPSIINRNNKKNPNQKHLQSLGNDEDSSLWEIRHQLVKITQMMKEMKNEIKFHEHEETSKEINKIESKNRKIASELKSVKE